LAVVVGMFGLHNAWVAAIGYHVGMMAMLTFDGGWGHARTLLDGRPRWRALAVLPLGLACGWLVYLCWPIFNVSSQFGASLGHLGITTASWPLFIAYFCVVNPWLEELYWRGYQGSASRRPVWNDLFFGGYHILVLAYFMPWPWLIIALLILSSTGWLWRQESRLSKGLLVPTASHFAADASIIIAVYLIASR